MPDHGLLPIRLGLLPDKVFWCPFDWVLHSHSIGCQIMVFCPFDWVFCLIRSSDAHSIGSYTPIRLGARSWSFAHSIGSYLLTSQMPIRLGLTQNKNKNKKEKEENKTKVSLLIWKLNTSTFVNMCVCIVRTAKIHQCPTHRGVNLTAY